MDVVIPNNNEQQLIDMALELGHTELVLLSTNISYAFKAADLNGSINDRIKIKTAYLVRDVSEIARARKRFDLVFARAERKFFEQKIDYIIGAEFSERKDSFHYRNTSLNQVHAKLAKQNNISIVHDFNKILASDKPKILLGRMMQNAKIVRKYKLKNACFSMARSAADIRSRTILDAFSSIL